MIFVTLDMVLLFSVLRLFLLTWKDQLYSRLQPSLTIFGILFQTIKQKPKRHIDRYIELLQHVLAIMIWREPLNTKFIYSEFWQSIYTKFIDINELFLTYYCDDEKSILLHNIRHNARETRLQCKNIAICKIIWRKALDCYKQKEVSIWLMLNRDIILKTQINFEVV